MLIRAARLEGYEAIEDGSLSLVEFGQCEAVRAPGFLAIGTSQVGAVGIMFVAGHASD
jgi:hypothetical protein